MAEKKKAETKNMADVARPGKSAPSDTAKPVIINHGPMMKDPMVVEDVPKLVDDKDDSEKIVVKTSKSTIKPLGEPSKTIAELAEEATAQDEIKKKDVQEPTEKPKPEEKLEVPAEPEESGGANTGEDDTQEEADPKAKSDAEKSEQENEAEEAKHDAGVQKLIDSKKFFLPINSVEQRKSKRFVALGIILSVLLALAWADIALDAGLIDVGGVKPVTHFFSN